MLFEQKERTRTAPKKPGEGEYAFYDSSARPEFQTYRDLLNEWISELPKEERAELIARFRKSDPAGYQAALAELTIHAALKRQGYDVAVHPPSGHPTRRPDFLARSKNGEPVAFLEVTTFGPTQELSARSNREAALYNAIDRAKLPPGWRLGYDVLKYGTASPNLGKARRAVEAWAAREAADDPTASPVENFDFGDWKIELRLFGGFDPDTPVERAIGIAMHEVRLVSAAIEIRQAMEKKGDRYGVLGAPYLIVIADCKGELSGGASNSDELIQAAFGTLGISFTQHASGETTTAQTRRRDGYWGWPEAPKQRHVSGVLLLPKPDLWSLRQARWEPMLLRNPWANPPLPDDLLPIGGWNLTDEDEFAPTIGTPLADILSLPTPWPPEA